MLFAVLTIISTGLLLPGVQSNSIASAVNNSFSIGTEHYNFPLVGELPVNYVGILIIVLLALIIFGGVKRLGKTAEFVVPFMAGIYILMAVIIIVLNIKEVPSVLKLIFSSAWL